TLQEVPRWVRTHAAVHRGKDTLEMPPTCHWHRRTRQLAGDVRSAARGRTPEDQIADTADHQSAQGVRTRPERYKCDPPRDVLRLALVGALHHNSAMVAKLAE